MTRTPVVRPRGNGGLRVLHLDHSAEPGGAELALLRLVDAPCPWVPVIHVSGRDPGVYASTGPMLRLSGVPQEAGATSAGGWRARLRFGTGLVTEAWRVRRSSAFADADVIHANTTRMIVVGRLALLFSGKRFVASIRDIVTADVLGGPTVQLVRWAGLRRTAAVIANSRSSLSAVEPWLRPGTTRAVIPSPIGVSKALGPTDDVSSDGPVTVAMVARLDPWKGQAELIRACAAHLAGMAWELRLAGSAAFGHAAYQEELRSLVDSLGVRDRVHFLGHVPAVERVLDASDVCVQFSTRPEPLGQNVLQYLARGRAVIAVDAGGPAEWIDSEVNGLLVPLGDGEALGRALRRVAEDPALRERLGRAAARTPGLLDDDEVTSAHFAVFEKAYEETR